MTSIYSIAQPKPWNVVLDKSLGLSELVEVAYVQREVLCPRISYLFKSKI